MAVADNRLHFYLICVFLLVNKVSPYGGLDGKVSPRGAVGWKSESSRGGWMEK